MSALFPEDVADYLKDNPAFFEQYADLMAQIFVPHPHGGRTISLSERQLLTLRERVKELEKKLHELIEYAKENDGLQEKLHLFTVALFGAFVFGRRMPFAAEAEIFRTVVRRAKVNRKTDCARRQKRGVAIVLQSPQIPLGDFKFQIPDFKFQNLNTGD